MSSSNNLLSAITALRGPAFGGMALLILIASGCQPEQVECNDEVEKEACQQVEYNGHGYAVVQIGEQCWFAENLRTDRYRDGAVIPELVETNLWESTTEGAMAVYPGAEGVLEQFGRLYNGHAVRNASGICPTGWKVPSDEDWTDLEVFVGEEGFEFEEGHALKSTTGWVLEANGLDVVGFNGRPGGSRSDQGGFDGYYDEFILGSDAFFWSSTAYGEGNWYRWLNHVSSDMVRQSHYSNHGLSIRCLKDE